VASKDKPYRVYRGGRAKGPIRHEPLKEKAGRRDGDGYTYKGPKPTRKPRRWRRRILWTLTGVILLFLVWAVLGYLAFRSGIEDANKRLDPLAVRALTPQKGLLLSNASNILVLGADTGSKSRQGTQGRADTIILIRTDPDQHKIALLSIPRDLRVEIPRHGTEKINAAYAFGGSTLAVKTVERVTGLRMNHVVVVDFSTFGEVVDALGGVTINVPHPILSNKFECPRHTQAQCARWPGWRFRKGPQSMDGHTALIYSRIRENQLNPADSDITRGLRQQAVMRAVMAKLLGFGTVVSLPFNGDSLLKPLATDLSAWQFVQLGWVLKRAGQNNALHCRLGGTATSIGGASVIVGNEDNLSVVQMVTGRAAPQPPRPGSGQYGPGCVVGNRQFR